MKTPILNHVALTVPRPLVSDTDERRRLLEFYERETLDCIVDRAKAFRAEHDPSVEIVDIATEDYGTIRIHSAYVRYLLPLMVEGQFYEGVETGGGES